MPEGRRGLRRQACNSKVLSARYFSEAFEATVDKADRAPEELISPVDVGSHGTHTASTAAGNANVETFVDGRSFGLTEGHRPGREALHLQDLLGDNDPGTGGCYTSASIDAINQAVLDGVDVLNYSISGTTSTTTDPVSMAFLSASSAGHLRGRVSRQLRPDGQHGQPRRALGDHGCSQQLLPGAAGHGEFSDGASSAAPAS